MALSATSRLVRIVVVVTHPLRLRNTICCTVASGAGLHPAETARITHSKQHLVTR